MERLTGACFFVEILQNEYNKPMAEECEGKNSFIRQRRNLIGASLVLFFFLSSGIMINKINILGTELSVKNPAYVEYVLWIVWGYFLLRYYQYFCHELPTMEIGSAFNDRMRSFVSKSAFKTFKRNFKPQALPDIAPPHKFKLESWSFGSNYEGTLRITISSKNTPQGATINHSFYLNHFQLIMPWTRSAINSAITTKYMTEYYLPFLIAATPFLYKLYSLA